MIHIGSFEFDIFKDILYKIKEWINQYFRMVSSYNN